LQYPLGFEGPSFFAQDNNPSYLFQCFKPSELPVLDAHQIISEEKGNEHLQQLVQQRNEQDEQRKLQMHQEDKSN